MFPTWITAHTDMYDRGMAHTSWSPGPLANAVTDIKAAVAKGLFIYNETRIKVGFQVPPIHKNPDNRNQRAVGLYFEKWVFAEMYGCGIFFAFCCQKLSSEVYRSILDTPCTGCPGRNVPDFGRMFLTLKYTDITQDTYVYTKLNGYGDNGEIILKYNSCYTHTDYQIHIKTSRNM